MKNGIVEFYGQSLITARSDEGVEYVAMKPLVENLGLDWEGQRKRIIRDEVLKGGMVIMEAPTGKHGNGGIQQMVFLPVELLNGWLFGIETSRLQDHAVKEKIIVYKKECFKVLHNYWSNKSNSVEARLEKLEVGLSSLADSIKEMAVAISKQSNTTNVITGSPFLALNRSLSDERRLNEKKEFIKAVIQTLEDYPDGVSQTELINAAGYSQSEHTRRWLQENIGMYWDMFIIPGNRYRYISKEYIAQINEE
jgi:hypothetical protein